MATTRVPATYGIKRERLNYVKGLVEKMLEGGPGALIAENKFISEALTTSDLPLALAHVINANIWAQYEPRAGVAAQFSSVRPVKSFRNITYYELLPDFTKLQHAGNEETIPAGILPVVPELTPYPEVAIKETTPEMLKQNKRGARFAFSWEALKEDAIGYLQDMPKQLVTLVTDTVDWVTTSALVDGVTGYSQFKGGVAPDGTVITANAPLTASINTIAMISLAMDEVRKREVNGRKIQVGRWVLVGSPELENTFNYLKTLTGLIRTEGNTEYNVTGPNLLANLTFVPDPYVATGSWYLVPVEAPRVAVTRLTLIGAELPELRVKADGGDYLGGGAVPWQEGSFDNDSIQFRLRVVNGAGLITEEGIVWSDGSGLSGSGSGS